MRLHRLPVVAALIVTAACHGGAADSPADRSTRALGLYLDGRYGEFYDDYLAPEVQQRTPKGEFIACAAKVSGLSRGGLELEVVEHGEASYTTAAGKALDATYVTIKATTHTGTPPLGLKLTLWWARTGDRWGLVAIDEPQLGQKRCLTRL